VSLVLELVDQFRLEPCLRLLLALGLCLALACERATLTANRINSMEQISVVDIVGSDNMKVTSISWLTFITS
jgi:hypothetical protein